MPRCCMCFKFRSELDEDGQCKHCAKNRRYTSNVNLNIKQDGKQKATPYFSNGKILSKERWIDLRSKIDRFYNNVSIDEIDHFNAEVAKANKNRALTKVGYIYLLSSDNGKYKIGKTTDVERRLNEHLRIHPLKLNVLHVVKVREYSKCERYLLNHFSNKRLQGEWFDLTKDDISWIRSLRSQSLESLAGVLPESFE